MNLRTRKIHRLKTWPGPFQATKHGLKPFEFRKNDRNFASGDILILDEWDPIGQKYTHDDPIVRAVTYILDEGFGLPAGHVVMGLESFPGEGVELVLLEVAPPRSTPSEREGSDG